MSDELTVSPIHQVISAVLFGLWLMASAGVSLRDDATPGATAADYATDPVWLLPADD